MTAIKEQLNRFINPLVGLPLALILSLYLNAPTLVHRFTDANWSSAIEQSLLEQDEARYIAKTHEIVDGHWNIGNASLKEHNNAISPTGYIEYVTAAFMKMTGLDIVNAIAITDLLYTFLNIFLTYLWVQKLLKNKFATVVLILMLMLDVWSFQGGLVRDSTPKITLLLVNMYLCVVALRDTQTHWLRIARGTLLGLMFYSYSYHWTTFLCFEMLMWFHGLFIEKKNWKSLTIDWLEVFGVFLVISLPHAVTLAGSSHTPEFIEGYRHFGLIETHLPSAPSLQFVLILCIAALLAARMTRLTRDRTSLLLLMILGGGLIAVNSNVISGREADFLGHYSRVLSEFILLTVIYGVLKFLKPIAARGIFYGITIIFVLRQFSALPDALAKADEARKYWSETKAWELMQWIDANTQRESVILAPYVMSGYIPALTDNYVLTGPAAQFYFVTDKEMLERYFIELSFFPETAEHFDPGQQHVFGNYPGQAWARARTAYQLRTLFQKPYPKTVQDFIVHQELLSELNAWYRRPDYEKAKKLMQKYEIDYLITDHDFPETFKTMFQELKTIGTYVIYKKI